MPASSTIRRVLAVGAVGLYWGVLCTLTHLPGNPGPEPLRPGVPHLDKVGHTAAFAVLAILACVVISQFRPVALRELLAVAIGLAVYAGLDEYTQGWVPLRTPDPLDWLADVAGILVGILLFVLIRRVLRRSASDATVTVKPPPT